MSRIKSTNIRFGDNFVLPIEKIKEEIQDSPEVIKLKAELNMLNKAIEQAKQEKINIINETEIQVKNLIEETNNKILAENEEIAKRREEEQKTFEEELAKEAAQIKEDAYKVGYDDGYKQGQVVITEELENKVRAVDHFAKCQFDLKGNIIKSSELDIINLVLEIGKKVCTESIKFNPDIIKILTENAIKELKDKEEITLIVNPALLEIINSVSERLKEDIPKLQSIKIIEDNAVSADGVIVESVLTRVDSRIKSQISEIAEKLFEAHNSEDEEFENYILSLDVPNVVEEYSNIELSDEVNIDKFLNELEEIPTYEEKIRDEDAKYYENLDLEELKLAENTENIEKEEQNLTDNNINFSEIEEDEPKKEKLIKELPIIEKNVTSEVESITEDFTNISNVEHENINEEKIILDNEFQDNIENSEDIYEQEEEEEEEEERKETENKPELSKYVVLKNNNKVEPKKNEEENKHISKDIRDEVINNVNLEDKLNSLLDIE